MQPGRQEGVRIDVGADRPGLEAILRQLDEQVLGAGVCDYVIVGEGEEAMADLPTAGWLDTAQDQFGSVPWWIVWLLPNSMSRMSNRTS